MIGAIPANLHEGSRSEYLAQYVFASFGTVFLFHIRRTQESIFTAR